MTPCFCTTSQPSAAVAATASRLAKRQILVALLARTPPDDIEIVVPTSRGELRQRRTGVGWATLGTLPDPAASQVSGRRGGQPVRADERPLRPGISDGARGLRRGASPAPRTRSSDCCAALSRATSDRAPSTRRCSTRWRRLRACRWRGEASRDAPRVDRPGRPRGSQRGCRGGRGLRARPSVNRSDRCSRPPPRMSPRP